MAMTRTAYDAFLNWVRTSAVTEIRTTCESTEDCPVVTSHKDLGILRTVARIAFAAGWAAARKRENTP